MTLWAPLLPEVPICPCEHCTAAKEAKSARKPRGYHWEGSPRSIHTIDLAWGIRRSRGRSHGRRHGRPHGHSQGQSTKTPRDAPPAMAATSPSGWRSRTRGEVIWKRDTAMQRAAALAGWGVQGTGGGLWAAAGWGVLVALSLSHHLSHVDEETPREAPSFFLNKFMEKKD